MTEKELISMAYAMREKQKEYYRTFDRQVLNEAKKLEKQLDVELEKYLHPESNVMQNDLFD